jgi:hypothetical protein
MTTLRKLTMTLLLGTLGCTGSYDGGEGASQTIDDSGLYGATPAFDHNEDFVLVDADDGTGEQQMLFVQSVNPFDYLDRLRVEGPPNISSRMHSCSKIKYATLGNVLRSRGVNMGNTAATSAGGLFRSGQQALAAPNYTARIGEGTDLSTASASRLFDIFIAAAPEIVAAMPMRQECMLNGAGTQFFDAGGQCTLAGISCLVGYPAKQAQVDICNRIITEASTPQIGRNIAVGVVAAAAFTCE